MIKVITTTRQKLNNIDQLGINETFEARIRGALTPYSTLLSILNDEDRDINDYPEVLENLKDIKFLNRILYLLNHSEIDRDEIENTKVDLTVSRIDNNKTSKRVKINFDTVNGDNYTVISKQDIDASNQRIKQAMKEFVRNRKRHGNRITKL